MNQNEKIVEILKVARELLAAERAEYERFSEQLIMNRGNSGIRGLRRERKGGALALKNLIDEIEEIEKA